MRIQKPIDISEGAKNEKSKQNTKAIDALIKSNAVQRYERASSSTIKPVLSTLTIWIDPLEFFSSFCRCFMLRPLRIAFEALDVVVVAVFVLFCLLFSLS